MTERPLRQDQISEELRNFVAERRSSKLIRIEPERELSKRFQVSRLSLRVAIKNLIDEGLLMQKQGSGTYILPKTSLETVHLLMAPDIKKDDPFYNTFLGELSSYLARESVNLRVIHLEEDQPKPSDAPLIIMGLCSRSTITRLKKSYRHIIATQSCPDPLEINQVHFDDYQIGLKAAAVLLAQGHRHIVHLSGPQAYPSAQERKRGFLSGVEGHGAQIEVLKGKMNWSCGYELGDTVVTLFRSRTPATAVFAANDWMALGLMQRLLEQGIRIPQDISIIGCDDIHLATQFTPNLATFRWDMRYLIKEAFAVLLDRLSNDQQPTKRVLLQAEFIARESLGKA